MECLGAGKRPHCQILVMASRLSSGRAAWWKVALCPEREALCCESSRWLGPGVRNDHCGGVGRWPGPGVRSDHGGGVG